MKLRPIVGNTENLALLAEIANDLLPMMKSQAEHMHTGIKAAGVNIAKYVQVQRDCKYIMRHRTKFTLSVVLWATKQKADANFDEHRYHADKLKFTEGFREARRMEFLLKSVIKLAAENADVSSNPTVE